MRKFGWLCGFLVAAAIGQPAAADMSDQIKQDLEAGIARLLGPAAESGLVYDAITVTANGDVYDVTIPNIRTAPDPSGTFEVGTIGLRIRPEGDDLYHLSDLTLPAEMVHKTADGGSDGNITVAGQRFTGTWSRSLQNLLAVDAAINGVKLISTTDNIAFGIGEIAAKADSVDKGGRWDQDATFRIADISFTSLDGVFALALIDGVGNARNYNLAAMAEFQNQLESWTAKADPAAVAPPPVPPELIAAARNLAGLFSSWMMNLRISGINFRDAAGMEMFNFTEGTFNLGLDSFDQPLARIALSYGHSGLLVGDLPPEVKEMVPGDLAINVSLENLPAQELWSGMVDIFSTADMSSDEGLSMANMMAMGLAQQALVNGKTKLNLTDWRIVAAAFGAQLSGLIETSAESMLGAVGQVKLDLTGLDRVIEIVKTMSAPDSSDAAMFEMLRGFSNRETAADGAVIDHYDVAFTPQGLILINGKEFNLFGPPPGSEMPPEGDMPPEGEVPPEGAQ